MTKDQGSLIAEQEDITALATERESASPSNFGFILVTSLILAALLGFSIYWLFGQNGSNNVVAANNTISDVRPTTVLELPDAQTAVIPPTVTKVDSAPRKLNRPTSSP